MHYLPKFNAASRNRSPDPIVAELLTIAQQGSITTLATIPLILTHCAWITGKPELSLRPSDQYRETIEPYQ
jgi:hypothetical protein